MISFFKQIILYVYILFTKLRQRNNLIEDLKRKCRPQRDVAFDKPGIPDSVDDVYGIPEGWTDIHSFLAFDNNGTLIRCNSIHDSNAKRDILIRIPSIGTLSYAESDIDEGTNGDETTQKKRLKTEVIDPMMKWKITYRGHMKLDSNENRQDRCFVRFNLYWCSIGDPHDFWIDTPSWQLAGECSNLPMSDALVLLQFKSVWFEQWGELRGSLRIDDNEFNIRMLACRERRYIREYSFEQKFLSIKSHHITVARIAHMYTYKTVECRGGSQLNFGHVLFPSLESYCTTKQETNHKSGPKQQFHAIACNTKVPVEETLRKCIIPNSKLEIQYHKYTMDGKPATGVSLMEDISSFGNKTNNTRGLKESMDNLSLSTREDNIIVIDIRDPACRNTILVGGKAANLCSLLALEYNVPIGFCITSNAFHTVINENPDLANSVRHIKSIIRNRKLENLKAVCDKTVQYFRACNININLWAHIEAKLHEIVTSENVNVAVRSSASGEDGEILSAAGQLETIIGVRGVDNIMEAIKQCWGSYFSFQSVEYRRQNGQLIVDGMGVIVQQMISADVSGVMMTNDPITGREDRIVINACFGLGEAVVSGKVDSDYVLVEMTKSGEFEVLKETTSDKSKRIDMLPSGETSMAETNTRTESCLSYSLIQRLCSIGKSIERKLKLEQEIEWAISEDCLFILQTRPITSLDDETEDDLFHEFDTPATGDRELITTCNLQEMMPGATTPLTTSYFVNAVNAGFAYIDTYIWSGLERVYHPGGFIVSSGNSYLMNMSPIYVMAANGIGGMKTKAFVEIDTIGEECKEVTANDVMNYKGTPLNSMWKLMTSSATALVLHNPKLKRDLRYWREKMHTYKLCEDSDDANSLYQRIDGERINLFLIWRLYFHMLNNTHLSIIKSILMGKSPNFTIDNKEDLSNLLIKVGTVSAEVPKAISKIATLIQTCGLSDEFIHLNDDQCLRLIERNTDLRRSFEDFMEKHGHRGIREAEFIEKSWSQDPLKLVRSLKSLVENGVVERIEYETDECKIEEVMKGLKTTLSPFKRWLIAKVFLKKALKRVIDRENGKAMVIKIVDAFKKAYWSLAENMVMESRIPEENVLFFLTHREIGELIDTRSPKLVRKAKRRMKIFTRQQSARFERLSFGTAHMLVESDDSSITPMKTSMVVRGLPIGNGEATGRVCIVTKEEDVRHIKKGDIMVCRYTDIGWSPYFPLINGLVTEIGSVLSHGAVVAREYGISCVVNVTNATQILKTGDVVRIHGNKGTIEKLFTD